ncbi:MAG: carbon-nitrogen hydrolase family protein [Planctomycetota bacterium]
MRAMKIALAQIAPTLLDRAATSAKIASAIAEAGRGGASLAVFGETLLPGYPAWIARTDGARFDASDQKELHALYLDQSVDIGEGQLDEVCAAARERKVAVCLGIAERKHHSIFASRVFIGDDGDVLSVHRKLRPTYEERLTWSQGDGAGLVVHRIGEFTVGGLNCWENWMPLARASLYAQGEDLHCMIWPGARRNTEALTPVVAVEARSYVVSVSGLLRESDVPASFPHRDHFVPEAGEVLHDGGSCLAAPDGSWVIPPMEPVEQVVVAEIDPARVREERQNFDPSGHYARPDVFRLQVDRKRHEAAFFEEGFL